MRLPPKNMIADDAVRAWRISESIAMGIVWIISIILLILSNTFDFPLWIPGIVLLGACLLTYICVFVIPKLRWRRWRYEIYEQEIYIQHGILIEKRTLVPMIRVQHVDTKQGPILKRYKLASVTISTAATSHEIPALPEEDAAALRDKISTLARVDEDDV